MHSRSSLYVHPIPSIFRYLFHNPQVQGSYYSHWHLGQDCIRFLGHDIDDIQIDHHSIARIAFFGVDMNHKRYPFAFVVFWKDDHYLPDYSVMTISSYL